MEHLIIKWYCKSKKNHKCQFNCRRKMALEVLSIFKHLYRTFGINRDSKMSRFKSLLINRIQLSIFAMTCMSSIEYVISYFEHTEIILYSTMQCIANIAGGGSYLCLTLNHKLITEFFQTLKQLVNNRRIIILNTNQN